MKKQINLNAILYGNKNCHYSFKNKEEYSFEYCENYISDAEINYMLLKTGIFCTKSQLINLIKSDKTFEDYFFKCCKVQTENNLDKNGLLNDEIFNWILSSLSLKLINKVWPNNYSDEKVIKLFFDLIIPALNDNSYSYDDQLIKNQYLIALDS